MTTSDGSSQELPTVIFPAGEDILERLDPILYDFDMRRELGPAFASLEGQELNGIGVNLAIHTALEEYGRTLPPAASGMLTLFVPRIIEALVDDDAVREGALEANKAVEDVVREQAESDRLLRDASLPERPELDDATKLKLVTTAWNVADIVFEYFATGYDREKPSLDDRRQDPVNPYHDQTTNGLLLEYYHGLPNKIWTPWGRYQFGLSGGSHGNQLEIAIAGIMTRVNTDLVHPRTSTESGVFGPLEAIRVVDGVELPVPEVAQRVRYLEAETARQEWEAISASIGRVTR